MLYIFSADLKKSVQWLNLMRKYFDEILIVIQSESSVIALCLPYGYSSTKDPNAG